jgi:hypothetical protein
VGEYVLLKVKAKRISLKLGCCPKLEVRYCGSFEVLERICHVSYMFALSSSMRIHNVFHVSLLKTYALDPKRIIDWIVIHMKHCWVCVIFFA